MILVIVNNVCICPSFGSETSFAIDSTSGYFLLRSFKPQLKRVVKSKRGVFAREKL